jgi:hypothetical protein
LGGMHMAGGRFVRGGGGGWGRGLPASTMGRRTVATEKGKSMDRMPGMEMQTCRRWRCAARAPSLRRRTIVVGQGGRVTGPSPTWSVVACRLRHNACDCVRKTTLTRLRFAAGGGRRIPLVWEKGRQGVVCEALAGAVSASAGQRTGIFRRWPGGGWGSFVAFLEGSVFSLSLYDFALKLSSV